MTNSQVRGVECMGARGGAVGLRGLVRVRAGRRGAAGGMVRPGEWSGGRELALSLTWLH